MPATSPGNAPGGPRSLIGDADRDRMTTLLREHYAAGRLGLDELRRRVGIVLAAAYADEAVVALADLPPIAVTGAGTDVTSPGTAGGPGHGKPRHRGRARPGGGTATRLGAHPGTVP